MECVKIMGDFETTTDPNDCRVWATCLYDIENDAVMQLSNNIKDTVDFLRDYTKYTNVELYYHNLKFDGHFWVSYLLHNGFTYDKDLSEKNTFNTLIADTGAFYAIEVNFHTKKRSCRLKILDSLKLIPISVSQMSKAFGLTELKGSIDYNTYRKPGHILTEDEMKYIIHDCMIVSKCLKIFLENDMDKMTIAANAMNSYKEIVGHYAFRQDYPILLNSHETDVLTINTADDFIRKSYKGGYVYVNPRFQNKIIREYGVTYDVNSLYPSVMHRDNLPYGMPIRYVGKYPENDNYPIYIQHIRCKFTLKKGYIPTVQLKGNSRFSQTEYIKDSGVERVDLFLTNIDLEIFLKHYDVFLLDYVEGYMFKASTSLFTSYIDKWIAVKIKAEKEGNKGMRQLAKLMLNSLYGKFAQNPNGAVKIPVLNEEGVVDLKTTPGEERELVYTAMASFITAYARRVTITAFQENIKRCCYCDTDSIHLLGDHAPHIYIHKSELGAWKYEGKWNKAKFIRPKTYMEYLESYLSFKRPQLFKMNECKKVTSHMKNVIDVSLNKGLWTIHHFKKDVKCAGMPKNLKTYVTINNFKVGLKLFGKLVPKRVVGGVVLVPSEYTLNK